MFKKILLRQTSGSRLKFSPNGSMGFTSGSNFVVASFESYHPSQTRVNLMFFEADKGVPAESLMNPSFATSFVSDVSGVKFQSGLSVEQAIEQAITASVISHIKSFNSPCEFEEEVFAPRVEPF